MKHRSVLLFLLLLPLALTGCSDGNSSAPAENEAHPLGWIKTHPLDALAAPGFADCIACHGAELQGSAEIPSCYSCHSYNTTPPLTIHPADWTDPFTSHRGYATANGTTSCTQCHGADLQGSEEIPSCYSCHSYNTTPPLTIHPTDWTDPYTSHRDYATANGSTSCAQCHGSNLLGSPAAPGCFSAGFEGRNCHADGPGSAPHPLDGTFLKGANHGPAAKGLTPAFPNGMADCQPCHGEPGGPGSNPRFNIGIDSAGGHGCEAEGCHGTSYAHPTDWAGPNATFHYSVGASAIQNSCTLCHGTNLDGVGGVGVSCKKCHKSTTTFTLDCTSCHAYPPDGTNDIAAPVGVAHGNVADDVATHDTCVVCHGMKESDTGGSFTATTNYLLFDKSTNTQGNHWNGQIDMNNSPRYDRTNFGCNAACHANDSGHRLSDSGLPVTLSAFGFGSAGPHPLDGTFLNPLYHGPAAKGLTAAFPNGMADCQPCHAQTGPNPRFNLGINSAGGHGCESCHNDFTAHPSAGGRDKTPWYDNTYKHSDVRVFTACRLCHGANLGGVDDGGVGPACTTCH